MCVTLSANEAKMFKVLCNEGHELACSDLGHMYETGKEVKKNYVKAIKLYDKACNGVGDGYYPNCSYLGVM